MISERQLNEFRDVVDVDVESHVIESESDNFREPQPLHRRKLLDVHTMPSVAGSSPAPAAAFLAIAQFAFMLQYLYKAV